ncbi:MAG: hypothetical protein Q7S87_17705 [Agitococcus sp.]|nr:hypothetical protein [Agitococcus sp.]
MSTNVLTNNVNGNLSIIQGSSPIENNDEYDDDDYDSPYNTSEDCINDVSDAHLGHKKYHGFNFYDQYAYDDFVLENIPYVRPYYFASEIDNVNRVQLTQHITIDEKVETLTMIINDNDLKKVIKNLKLLQKIIAARKSRYRN